MVCVAERNWNAELLTDAASRLTLLCNSSALCLMKAAALSSDHFM
jgi:hypothetical protein